MDLLSYLNTSRDEKLIVFQGIWCKKHVGSKGVGFGPEISINTNSTLKMLNGHDGLSYEHLIELERVDGESFATSKCVGTPAY